MCVSLLTVSTGGISGIAISLAVFVALLGVAIWMCHLSRKRHLRKSHEEGAAAAAVALAATPTAVRSPDESLSAMGAYVDFTSPEEIYADFTSRRPSSGGSIGSIAGMEEGWEAERAPPPPSEADARAPSEAESAPPTPSASKRADAEPCSNGESVDPHHVQSHFSPLGVDPALTAMNAAATTYASRPRGDIELAEHGYSDDDYFRAVTPHSAAYVNL